MNLDDYQQWTRSTAIYPKDFPTALSYVTIGLSSEAGEVSGKVKKWIRDGAPLNDLKAELGDCLYYLARLSDECGWSLQEVMEENKQKLEDRKARNVLKGSGDLR